MLKVLPDMGSDRSTGVAGVEPFGVVHLQARACACRQQWALYAHAVAVNQHEQPAARVHLLRVFTGIASKMFY